jgi:hypothetical protein
MRFTDTSKKEKIRRAGREWPGMEHKKKPARGTRWLQTAGSRKNGANQNLALAVKIAVRPRPVSSRGEPPVM